MVYRKHWLILCAPSAETAGTGSCLWAREYSHCTRCQDWTQLAEYTAPLGAVCPVIFLLFLCWRGDNFHTPDSLLPHSIYTKYRNISVDKRDILCYYHSVVLIVRVRMDGGRFDVHPAGSPSCVAHVVKFVCFSRGRTMPIGCFLMISKLWK